MARPEKTESVLVCVDADVLIAGLLSRTGASHAILVLGELGLLRLVLPEAAVAEVRRNLASELPEAAPLFEFLRAVPQRKAARARRLDAWMHGEKPPLVGVWHELIVDEDRVPHLTRTVLERQRNEIAESAPGQGVLVGEQAIVRSQAELMTATHRLGDDVAAQPIWRAVDAATGAVKKNQT